MHINIHFLQKDHYWPKKISQHPMNSLKWFFIPRNYFDRFLREYITAHVKKHCIYFLIWKDEESADLVYVWETTQIENRISTHIQKRERIESIIMIELNQNYWKSILQYIEWILIQKVRKYWRYKDDNSTKWFSVDLEEANQDSADEMIIEIEVLLDVLWYNFLKPPIWSTTKSDQSKEKMIWIQEYKIDSPKAVWLYDGKRMTVTKWSQAKKARTWISNNSDVIRTQQRVETLRNNLLEKWIIKIDWDYCVFQHDYEFNSSSAAAHFIVCTHWSWPQIRGIPPQTNSPLN